MTIVRTPAAKARSMTCFRSAWNERCARFTPISTMSCDSFIAIDGFKTQEAFAAVWMVSFNAVNRSSDTQSYSLWSEPSKPISFQEPIPPNTQADWQASSKPAANCGALPSTISLVVTVRFAPPESRVSIARAKQAVKPPHSCFAENAWISVRADRNRSLPTPVAADRYPGRSSETCP